MNGIDISAINQAMAPCDERGRITASIAHRNPTISAVSSIAPVKMNFPD
jgi:hypothetical protein